MIDRLFTTPVRAVALYRYWNTDDRSLLHDQLVGARRWRAWLALRGNPVLHLSGAGVGIDGTLPLLEPGGDRPLLYDRLVRSVPAVTATATKAFKGYVQPTPDAGARPLHRYWNAVRGDHFYTTNWSELGGGAGGYRYEGVQCHVFSRQVLRVDASSSAEAEGVVAGFGTPELAGAAFAAEPEFAFAEGAVVVTPFAEKAAAVGRRAEAVGGPGAGASFPQRTGGRSGPPA